MKTATTLLSTLLLAAQACFAQETFKTDADHLRITVNGELKTAQWRVDPKSSQAVFKADCKAKENTITYSDGKDSVSFPIQVGQKVDFIIVNSKNDTARQQIVGVVPNVNFTDEYVKNHRNKTTVAIPEVSELVNILMALHQDAEKEGNMFDTKSDYYQRLKTHFAPYRNHPMLDTVHKYIGDMRYLEQHKLHIFSDDSYGYYYALKMNAVNYNFDKQGTIKNNGIIREAAAGWYTFDPMKDLALMEDFAKKSNFRKFYADNKPYYDSLLTTYNQLNHIDKMQAWLDKKFNMRYGSYMIYFSPLIGGAHSTQRFSDNGLSQTVMYIQKANALPDRSQAQNEIFAGRVVFTEIDHNYVNPTTDRFADAVNEIFSQRETWADGNITSGYSTAYTVFNEYMTWAVYSLYLADHYSQADLDEYLPKMVNQMEKSRGFINFGRFNNELLKTYNENRSASMDSLYTHMLNWARAENKKS